jgi:peptidoglycan/xylan/chitin deacetylase (PgdA/CDA1 family)
VSHRRLLVALFAVLALFGGLIPPGLAAPRPQAKTAPLVRQVFTTRKAVALTFDDGPSPTATPLLLDYLKQQKIRATFFIIGQEAARFPQLVAREVAEGHDVGNHGMRHKALGRLSEAAMEEEIRGGEEALVAAGAPKPTYYRLPKAIGSKTAYAVLGRHGYTVISWSVDPRDYQRRTSGALVKDVMRQVQPGSIIIFHDGPGRRAATLEALREIVPQLRAQGYTILPVSQLLKVPMHS